MNGLKAVENVIASMRDTDLYLQTRPLMDHKI